MTKMKQALKRAEPAAGEEKGGFLFLYRGEVAAETIPTPSPLRDAGGEKLLQQEMFTLYRSVENLLPDRPQKTLQFIGSHEGAGVSTVVRIFARTAAERLGKSVLILDAAHHNPTQHLHFDLVQGESWIDVVQSGGCAEKACHQVGTSTLFLSPASLQPAVTLEIPAVTNFLDELKGSFHYILIDSSPVGNSPDTLALSGEVDGVILVFEADRTRWPVALALKEQTERNGGRVLGMIFNKRRHHIPDFLYRRL
ncbi:CpsD/CapB family tyrosine-protein kinase [Geomonas sp. RF6]|uniref:CpsD/CapB family tyrosine-protein kinase n=1 Tax=Geomonas sp. RF6 TaxID=2897342 RepID=UPI001E2CC4C3|nr:CpsD/CapB family tyrosine-protein kinase [Geomonas sp. RF6]UFS69337.1 CpsD/CapB family tyrosine-protein kinase [Geomonas sp. RF6]